MAKTDWKETEGRVASVLQSHSKAGSIYEVVFTYTVDGSWYGGTFTSMTFLSEGDALLVRYDVTNPERNNFSRREGIMRWVYIISFTLVGLLAIYYLLHPELK